MINFDTLGPFALSRRSGEIDEEVLDDFWSVIESKHPSASDAAGVYIIGTRRGDGAIKPWYVGQTHRRYESRFKQHSRGKLFRRLCEVAPNGDLMVFLIAKTTRTGKFWRGKKTLRSISYLEFALIGNCLSQNARLLNVSHAGFYKRFSVPGFTKGRAGKPGLSARELSKMLGQQNKGTDN